MNPEPAPRHPGLAETSRENAAKPSTQRGTVAPPVGPASTAGEALAKTSIQSLPPGACPGGGIGDRAAASPATPSAPASPDLRNPGPPTAAQPRQPACEQLVKDPTYPGTVRLAASPFRHGLLASTVSNTPDAQNFAAMVERAGGWLIVMAADAAQQQGKDWRPAAAAARQRARLAPLPAAYMPCPPGDP